MTGKALLDHFPALDNPRQAWEVAVPTRSPRNPVLDADRDEDCVEIGLAGTGHHNSASQKNRLSVRDHR